MPEPANLSQIEAHCMEILNSPYLRREAPVELQKLRDMISKVDVLVRTDVPTLIGEVKRLRSQVKRLEAEVTELRGVEETVTTE
jgi:hypothetical protein